MSAVLPPLQIGRHTYESPVVLAPMAGITNRAFRRLCREHGAVGLAAAGATGATQLFVSEMITTRALVERVPLTMKLIEMDEGSPRARSSCMAWTRSPSARPPGSSPPRTAPTTST